MLVTASSLAVILASPFVDEYDLLSAVPVTETVTVVDTVPATEPVSCQEDDPCWNECEHGVNGFYPDHDPRYYIPGPCNLATELPYGQRFSLEFSHVPAPSGDDCQEGHEVVAVTVTVVTPDGEVSQVASDKGCAPADNPLGGDVAGSLDSLFRQAAAGL
jgi:hypothetical protein